MAILSPDERVIIAKHPLGNSLDQLRESLQKIELSHQPDPLSYDGAVDSSEQGPQKAISRLLSVLQGHEVAFDLRSKTGQGDVSSELSMLFRRVRNGDFNYEQYRALSRLVINQAPDVIIWNAVLNLLITVSQTTPPTGIPVSFDGTPITHSSASQQSGEQTRKLLEGRIFEEIRESTYQDVDGFFLF